MIELSQILSLQSHFKQHFEQGIPVQVLNLGLHLDIGKITALDTYFVEISGKLYNRQHFTFISRPGY